MGLDPFGWPVRNLLQVIPRLGSPQRFFKKTEPSHSLREYAQEPVGGEFRLITCNWPESEWSDPEWQDWLRRAHEKGVRSFILGGKPENPDSTNSLIEEGIFEARVLKKEPTRHFGLIDNPKQIWFEGHHANGEDAFSCVYTPGPYPEVWNKLKNLFDSAWDIAKPLKVASLA